MSLSASGLAFMKNDSGIKRLLADAGKNTVKLKWLERK